MGIASGIFWIILGLLYILYRAFRDSPGETAAGVVVCGAVIMIIIILMLCTDWLNSVSPGASIAVGMVIAAVGIFVICKKNADEKRRAKTYEIRMAKALHIARSEPIDEQELAKWEREAWKSSTGSSLYPNYRRERTRYAIARDKSQFRDMIIDDYIINKRVPEIMRQLNQEGS